MFTNHLKKGEKMKDKTGLSENEKTEFMNFMNKINVSWEDDKTDFFNVFKKITALTDEEYKENRAVIDGIYVLYYHVNKDILKYRIKQTVKNSPIFLTVNLLISIAIYVFVIYAYIVLPPATAIFINMHGILQSSSLDMVLSSIFFFGCSIEDELSMSFTCTISKNGEIELLMGQKQAEDT